jgi:hypothetical protein
LISDHFGDSISGPEKAGVGGSIPSLATNPFNKLDTLKTRVKISRAYNTRTSISLFSLLASLVRLASKFPNPCCWLLQCAVAPACHLLFLLWELKIIYELAKDRG